MNVVTGSDGEGLDSGATTQGGGTERQGSGSPDLSVLENRGSDPLGLGTLVRKSAELGTQIGGEATRAGAFKEASKEVLLGGSEIVKLVSNPQEAHKVTMALAELAIKILNKH